MTNVPPSKKRSILEIVQQELEQESSKKKKFDEEKSFSFMNNTFQKLSMSEKPRITEMDYQVLLKTVEDIISDRPFDQTKALQKNTDFPELYPIENSFLREFKECTSEYEVPDKSSDEISDEGEFREAKELRLVDDDGTEALLI